MAVRAIAYERNGDPASVLCAVTLPPPDPLSGKSINVKVLLSPINPSNLLAINGSYATQPIPRKVSVNGQEKKLRLPGNEGLGEVVDVGPDVTSVKRGDWVVFGKGKAGRGPARRCLKRKMLSKWIRSQGSLL